MKEELVERFLTAVYLVSAILAVTSLICLVTAWQYWAWILDVCISVNCGCILYGINTFSTFMGGDAKLCHFGVYGLIPAIVVGLLLAGYHGYRCCIDRGLQEPVRIGAEGAASGILNVRTAGAAAAQQAERVVVRPKRRKRYKQWIPAAFLTLLLCCLSLSHAVVTTDGYYKTCEQYRKRLIQVLGSTGREAEVVHNRLSCGAIFDFMDYLQSDVASWKGSWKGSWSGGWSGSGRDSWNNGWNNGWKGGKEIDTGFALRLAIISTWGNFVSWTTACLFNATMAWRRRLRCRGS